LKKKSANRFTIKILRQGYRLEDFQGVYVRLMDDQSLPELKDEPSDSPSAGTAAP